MEDSSISDKGPGNVQKPTPSGLSQPSPVQIPISPDDDYNYEDLGSVSEDQPTRPILPTNTKRIAWRETETANNESVAADSTDGRLFNTNIFEREAGGRRAKLPDREVDISDQAIIFEKNVQVSRYARQAREWIRERRSKVRNLNDAKQITKVRHILLAWTKSSQQSALIFNEINSIDQSDYNSEDCVIWQHSEVDSLSIAKFTDLVNQSRPSLNTGQLHLMHRLLKRVRERAERPFFGGKYLEPVSMRYDAVNRFEISADDHCTFLAFPYFALEPMRNLKKSAVGDEHPPRSLIQCTFRLYNAHERDKSQSVKLLKGGLLRSGVENMRQGQSRIRAKIGDRIFYVPQIWCLIVNSGHILTAGTISDFHLRADSIEINEVTAPPYDRERRLVRIHFMTPRGQESLTYPLQQCNSWYGLLNKQQDIRCHLEKIHHYDKSRKYKLKFDGKLIEPWTWTTILEDSGEKVLNIEMELVIPVINISGTELPQSKSTENNIPKKDDEVVEGPKEVSITSAFLAWEYFDGLGTSQIARRPVEMILNGICQSLPATLHGQSESTSSQSPDSRSQFSFRTKSPELIIVGMSPTMHDVETIETAHDKFRARSKQFAHYFIPLSHNKESESALQFFWGMVCEIWLLANADYVSDLEDKFRLLNLSAARIHLGVKIYNPSEISAEKTAAQMSPSKSPCLFTGLVDAFDATLRMCIEAVHELRVTENISKCGGHVKRLYGVAMRGFDSANDELIKTSNGSSDGNSMSPVSTPEMILIQSIRRLVEGSLDEDKVDIINVFDECLEGLVLRVTDRYSRRLLEFIDAFEEEVQIVNGIIEQQIKALRSLQTCLDPKTFSANTLSREMRYGPEKVAIEEILSKLQEQSGHCGELTRRAQKLAKQNILLVETLQDRAIFIFTISTVFFLPISFVSSFFGMNVRGISSETNTTTEFWAVAVPFTSVVVLLCTAAIIWGERLWFWINSLFQLSLGRIWRRGERLL